MPPVSARNSAAAWTVAVTLVSAAAQLLQIGVAARYLTHADFGVLAIINVMLAVVTAFQDLGLSSYCVHLGDVPRRSHSTLFWISTALGALGTLVVLAISFPVATFYEMPALVPLLQLLAINFLVIGLSGQYQANYIRVFQAAKLAKIELGARMVGLGTALALLTIAHWGPQAIVTGMLVFALSKLVLPRQLGQRALLRRGALGELREASLGRQSFLIQDADPLLYLVTLAEIGRAHV